MKPYDHKKIEKKWQKVWDEKKVYQTLSAKKAQAKKLKPYYVLDMFPYPSGAGLHVGHPRGYIASDVFARMKRMEGYNVLHPMGFDSFGLPAEQYAIQTGKNPGPFTEQLVKRYRQQLSILGFSFDWDREVATHRPEFYQWTQWIFLQIYNSYYDTKKNKACSISDLVKQFEKSGNGKVSAVCDADTQTFSKKEWNNFSELEKQKVLMKYRLAYEGEASVNWCPEMGTVLANDEIIDGPNGPVSERGGFPVEKKQMRQWFMRITAYGDRLLQGLETIDWPDNIKEIQKNWIGKSEGSEIDFTIAFRNKQAGTLSLSIENAQAKDAETMWEICARGWLENNINPETGFTKEFLEQERGLVFPIPKVKIEKLQEKIKNSPKNYFVAKIEGTVVGWLGFQIHEDKKISFGIYVDSHVTGKGIGTALINNLFSHYPNNEYEIEVSKTNRAIGLYQKLGFSIIGENKFFQKGITDKYLPVFKMFKNVKKITVFTTRADTLFGVTYVVLAPEHPLVSELKSQITNWDEVAMYLDQVKNKSEIERTDAKKEKTGICLEGVFAVNPANGEQVPVWIADYVLANYGTGAVMAVPAHDERDFEFANNYDLPMREVVSREQIYKAEREGLDHVFRRTVDPIIYDSEGNYYLVKENEKSVHFAGGGIEDGETDEEAVRREVIEELGFTDFSIIRKITPAISCSGFHSGKNRNQTSVGFAYEVVLNSLGKVSCEADEGKHEIIKVKKEDVLKTITWEHHRFMFERYLKGEFCYDEDGLLINSGDFNRMTSEQARKAITEFVGGRLVTKYKFRDAIFARQRYWGEPIPLVHEKDGTISEVPLKNLPLELPNVKSYAPAGNGESPLATVKSWVNAGYETNTMPGWAGSSWYFLRYTDPKNNKAFAKQEELDYWFGKKNTGVDMYVGGAEHATGHLLYSRFWHKFLKDIGQVATEEPFKALRNQGMIGGPDGRKMSKRYGNVVNPDDVVAQFGADSLRVFEMFLGPFESHLPWSTDGIIGSRRFIERVWRLSEKMSDKKTDASLEKSLHKTIKKVSEDIMSFSFNTAISAMMIFINEAEKTERIGGEDFKKFLKILAPFAPHVTEDLWSSLGEKNSIHLAGWPKYDEKLIIDDSIKMGIQVNGKVRAEIELALDVTEADVKSRVLQIPDIQKWIDGKEIKKFIYIPKKIISIVV